MPAPVRLRGVTVETERLDPESRRTIHIDPQIVMRVSVGQESKFRAIDLSESEALALIEQTVTAITRARQRRADREKRATRD